MPGSPGVPAWPIAAGSQSRSPRSPSSNCAYRKLHLAGGPHVTNITWGLVEVLKDQTEFSVGTIWPVVGRLHIVKLTQSHGEHRCKPRKGLNTSSAEIIASLVYVRYAKCAVVSILLAASARSAQNPQASITATASVPSVRRGAGSTTVIARAPYVRCAVRLQARSFGLQPRCPSTVQGMFHSYGRCDNCRSWRELEKCEAHWYCLECAIAYGLAW